MIAIHYQDGRYIPVIICDTCEKRILDADLAAVLHTSGDPMRLAIFPGE